ncbi:inner membrane protein YgaP [Pasteurella multocida]|nr:inner membrane protein YgaP [Pasteurella multocida]
MSITIISAQDAQQRVLAGAVLVDIRQPDEHRREHIEGAKSIPLEELNKGPRKELKEQKVIIFHCKSGMRTKNAQDILAKYVDFGAEVYVVEKGIDGWKAANLPVVFDKKQPLEMMRQVQIAAGSLVLLGSILGLLASPYFFAVPLFVGAGLIFAGVTGFCGMARLLALMPWNR